MNYQEMSRGRGKYISLFLKNQAVYQPGYLSPENLHEDNVTSIDKYPKKRLSKSVRIRIAGYALSGVVILTLLVLIYIAFPKPPDSYVALTATGITDEGLLRGQTAGSMFNPEISVTDGGYHLEIKEVSADNLRIVMALQITDKKGNPVPDKLRLGKDNHIVVKDGEGNVVAELSDVGKTKEFYLLSAVFPEVVRTDKLEIEGNIYYLNESGTNHEVQNGDWSFHFTVDMTNMNKIIEVQPVDKEYEVTKGVFIRVKELINTATSTRINVESVSRGNKSMDVQELMFHFEDSDGKEIHNVGSTKPGHISALLDVSRTKDQNAGIALFSYTFIDIPQGATFVLDGASLSVKDDSMIEFRYEDLTDGEVMFDREGDQIYLRDLVIDAGNKDSNPSAFLKIDGYTTGNMLEDQWILQKKYSQEIYKLTFRGAFSPSGKGQNIDEGSEFVIEGLNKRTDGDILVLKRIGRYKNIGNIEWSFPL
ncbi:hypothetical protein [Paenibacillus sp. Marseille-Q4541]|uniref:hypothetical protein n=1 Tax=Paenibacillus sp. Marseille-Q4541 TaxID=2831522 RepID=UPI001BAC1A18|nr:hypothetical protein [Paenibacillus sp. Marseille-Q4541]